MKFVKNLSSSCTLLSVFSFLTLTLFVTIIASAQVNILSPANYATAYLNEGDTYYIDRAFTITSIPSEFDGLLWIKTGNNDKSNTDEQFLQFTLGQNAVVYIAYDERIQNKPDWLTLNFSQTGHAIGISDPFAGSLHVWSAQFGSGTHTLGGNVLAGEDASDICNYVVLIKLINKNPDDPLAQNTLELVKPLEYTMSKLVVGDEYYIDRSFTLTHIPAEFANLYWIKTGNDDKNNTENNFIEINSTVETSIFIAYDDRALSKPDWLTTLFTRTDVKINISDTFTNNLVLWEKRYPAGNIILGANACSGASFEEDMVSNYVVLIRESYMPLTIIQESLSNGALNQAYETSLHIIGGQPPYTWTIDSQSLPNGLSLDTQTGEISGTPVKAGSFPFTVKVTDNENNEITQEFSLSISGTTPPVSPKWVFEPWVWEDNINTQESTWDLVSGYISRDIPIGAVILDSPWENPKDVGYNTFEFDTSLYPNPQQLIDDLNANGVHVMLWMTGVIVTESPNYNFACQNGYFVRKVGDDNTCPTTYFWKGNKVASHVDFFNPDALAWWQSMMQPILDMGIDGWKVDQSDYFVGQLGETVQTAAGIKTKEEYTDAYYRTMYNYTIETRGNDLGMIMARPFNSQTNTPPPHFYAPINVNTAGWVGDQAHDWNGLREALTDIFISSAAGYAAVGSDIGGYNGSMEMTKNLLLRWAQLGAMVPIMENGGLKEHRPWEFDQETVDIYRYYAKLHHQLVPYLYSYDIEAHRTGVSIVRPIGIGNQNDISNWQDDWRYFLGDNLFIAAIFKDQNSRSIRFPDGTWIDYWDDDTTFQGGETINYSVPLAHYPIFIRAGAIIPLNIHDSITGHGSQASEGFQTVLIYPRGSSEYTFHQDEQNTILFSCSKDIDQTTISVSASTEAYIFKVKYPAIPETVKLDGINLPMKSTFSQFESAESGWYYDSQKKYVWIKYNTTGSAAIVKITDMILPVELDHFAVNSHGNSITLFWSTASETNNYGFTIERKKAKDIDDEGWIKIGFVKGSGTTAQSHNYHLVDTSVPSGKYIYRLKQIDFDGTVHLSVEIEAEIIIPNEYILEQNHPNPFNSSTVIRYRIPRESWVNISIYNLLSQKIKTLVDEQKGAGDYSIHWDGFDSSANEAPNGVYFYRLEAIDNNQNPYGATEKMLIVK